MRKLMIGSGAALSLALAACGGASERGNEGESAGADNVQQRIGTMAEGQRNAVFLRAIRDARQACQHVESSTAAGDHQGFPVWTARCDDGGTWTIVIGEGGTAQVLNAAETQLVGEGNSAAPRNPAQ